ncbi:MAG: DUF1761 domain-containing protein [Bacteroidales bacterium]|nr:DUF1761 domain-containing protein [Bacteroidales bacterium]
MQAAFTNLNWLAIVVAAASAFILGSLWYSNILFGKRWMKENNLTEEEIGKGNMVKIFGLAFLAALVASFFLAMFVGTDAGVFGAMAGLMAGIGWVMTSVGMHYLFEHRSFALFMINSMYSVVSLTLMGLIIGLWQ